MIIKSFEIHKIRFELNNIILLYGKTKVSKKKLSKIYLKTWIKFILMTKKIY